MSEAGITKVLALVADDPEVKERAKALALQALQEAEALLHYGNDTIRMRIIGAMLPAFQKSLQEDKSETTGFNQLQQEFKDLRAAVMGDDEAQPGN